MNNKNRKYSKPIKKSEQKGSQVVSKPKIPVKMEYPAWHLYAILGAIVILTFGCFHYSLNNQFLNWDDGVYIVKNQYIKSFSGENLKMMLFHGITPSNYHPLTMVSLAVNYHFSQLEPHMYYFTNILIHLANVVLVFLLASALCKHLKMKYASSLLIAGICALWFGIHPMHVESVSWISERKDVLYTFFYLLGLLFYLNYLDSRRAKWYIYALLVFAASCLSKPMAVSFPLILFTIDFLLGRKWDKKLFIEKIPFLLGSAIFGIVAYLIQKNSGAVADFQTVSFVNRIFFAFYGFNMYLVKFLWPFHLNGFYPYPDFRVGVALPVLFYVMPFVTALIVCVPFYFKRKGKENLYRIILFGLAFYFFDIVFVLQFISCGDAIIADRYTYVAYIGIIFMIMCVLDELVLAKPSLKNLVIVAITGLSLMFAVLCYGRTKVWHNPETFWTDVIAKSNMHSQLPYIDLGNYYADSGKYDKAYPEYTLLVRLDVKDAGIFRNLAMIYGLRKQFDSSLYCFAQAIKYDSTDASIYDNRGVTYANLGKLELALKDFTKAYSLDTTQDGTLAQMASVCMDLGQFNKAVTEYDKLISHKPQEPAFYLYRGKAYLNGGNAAMTVKDCLHVLDLQPNNGECMYYLSVAYDRLSDEQDALNYALKANQNKYTVPADYLGRLQKFASK